MPRAKEGQATANPRQPHGRRERRGEQPCAGRIRSRRARYGRNLAGGGKVFAGQRDDAFFGDVGAIFDLLGFRKGTGAEGGGKDFLAGYAVHAIALQIPISQVDTKSHVIGIWSTADRKVIGVRRNGGWVQVSRLANPLVNEVVIPTGLKDRWNASGPAEEGKFAKYYRTPILAAVMNKLYKLGVQEGNRSDLVSVFLTGVNKPSLNYTGPKLAEELRLNLSIPVTPAGQVQPAGRPRRRPAGLAERPPALGTTSSTSRSVQWQARCSARTSPSATASTDRMYRGS